MSDRLAGIQPHPHSCTLRMPMHAICGPHSSCNARTPFARQPMRRVHCDAKASASVPHARTAGPALPDKRLHGCAPTVSARVTRATENSERPLQSAHARAGHAPVRRALVWQARRCAPRLRGRGPRPVAHAAVRLPRQPGLPRREPRQWRSGTKASHVRASVCERAEASVHGCVQLHASSV
jgi:hypothetical protein